MIQKYKDWGSEEEINEFVRGVDSKVREYVKNDEPDGTVIWQYGIVKEGDWYSIRDVIYKNGVPVLCESNPVFYGKSLEGIRKRLIHILYNFDKIVEGVPIIDRNHPEGK